MSEEQSDYTTFPPKVAAAIVAVMGEVPKLAKTEKNTHGSYNFASIDDFLEAVRPLCAKHGLIIAQDEESFEVKESDKSTWLMIGYSFTLAHASGEVWDHKPKRTIMVNAKMGSQAFGAAQSYALKQYMRSLFQIATGEKGMDADEHPQSNLPASEKVWAKEDAPAWIGPLGKAALKKKMREFAEDLKNVSDEDELTVLREGYKVVLDQCAKEPQMEDWWHGTDEQPGASQAILTKAQELARAAREEPNPLDAG